LSAKRFHCKTDRHVGCTIAPLTEQLGGRMNRCVADRLVRWPAILLLTK